MQDMSYWKQETKLLNNIEFYVLSVVLISWVYKMLISAI
jgi:hypothetical protein